MKLEISGPDGKRVYTTRAGASLISVGRGTSCDISFPKDAGISDLHLRFNQFFGQWSVTDQFSEGGTQVNGEKTFNTDIKPGDVIVVGSTTMRITSMESEARSSEGAAHSGKFEFTSPTRAQAPLPARQPDKPAQPSFESVSSDPLQWKDPSPAISSTPTLTVADAFSQPASRVQTAPAQQAAPQPQQAWTPTAQPAPQAPPRQLSRAERKKMAAAAEASRAAAPWEARQTAASPTTSRPAKAKNNLAGCVVGGIIIGGIAIGIFSDVFSSDNKENKSKNEPLINTSLPVKPEGGSWTTTSQDEAKRAIKNIRDDKSRPPAERIEAIQKLVRSLPASVPAGVNLSRDQALLALQTEIYLDLSAKLGDVRNDVSSLPYRKNFRVVSERMGALKKDAQLNVWAAQQAKKLDLAAAIKEADADFAEAHGDFVGERLYRADQLISLKCNALALKEYQALLKEAVLAENVLAALQMACERLATDAKASPGPETAPRLVKPLSPPPPKNGLLPDGARTQSTLLIKLRTRLTSLIDDRQLNDATCPLYGQKARVAGSRDSMVLLEITRVLPGGVGMDYHVALPVRELPPESACALYTQLPEPTADHWLSVMLYCFDNGLNDDAARAALRMSKLSPASRTELESIMAAKLGIRIPDGGFIERGDMLVPG